MDLSQGSAAEKATIDKVSSASGLSIQTLNDGVALVFDQNTGGTTLINSRALALLNILRSSGAVSELVLCSVANQVFPDTSELLEILTSLEKSKLVIRD